MAQPKPRFRQFTDGQWEPIEPLPPSDAGRQGHGPGTVPAPVTPWDVREPPRGIPFGRTGNPTG